MREPGRIGLENALQHAGYQRGDSAPRPSSAKPQDDREPIVLGVVATGDNPTTKVHEVIFEDPEGVQFAVPSAWVDPVMLAEAEISGGEEGFYHTDISGAPPGELEKVWREATMASGAIWDASAAKRQLDSILGPAKSRPDWSQSVLDKWAKEPTTPGWQDKYLPEVTEPEEEVLQNSPSGWRPTLPKPKAATMRKEDIPPDAGSGWGDADDVWNPKTQRWEKKRGSR